ncbi:hypothetical protein HPP92_006504 [Vanilla planifolia]|uniref:Uncharacterized protein n=1 Tax=Vanilla planifolia TaxID=51239 RepID=A0A835VB00_VANPL|nr:hypothetical protein HPP92_006504 [Vanilla planifolia]
MRRRDAPRKYSPNNNRFVQWPRSVDGRVQANDRRRSVSVKRGREPMRRAWARKNSVEGQHINHNIHMRQLGAGIHMVDESHGSGGKAMTRVQHAEKTDDDDDAIEFQYDDPRLIQ